MWKWKEKKKLNEKGGKINEEINEQAGKKWSVKCQVSPMWKP